jgi:hypothetical protein
LERRHVHGQLITWNLTSGYPNGKGPINLCLLGVGGVPVLGVDAKKTGGQDIRTGIPVQPLTLDLSYIKFMMEKYLVFVILVPLLP